MPKSDIAILKAASEQSFIYNTFQQEMPATQKYYTAGF